MADNYKALNLDATIKLPRGVTSYKYRNPSTGYSRTDHDYGTVFWYVECNCTLSNNVWTIGPFELFVSTGSIGSTTLNATNSPTLNYSGNWSSFSSTTTFNTYVSNGGQPGPYVWLARLMSYKSKINKSSSSINTANFKTSTYPYGYFELKVQQTGTTYKIVRYSLNFDVTFEALNDITITFLDHGGTQKPTVGYTSSYAYTTCPSPKISSYESNIKTNYVVNCNYNDGSGKNDQKTIIKQDNYKYVFSGWGDKKLSVGARYETTTSVVVNANYSKNSSGTTWPSGESINLPNISSEGLTFKGWFTAALGGDKVNSPYKPQNTITNLYAHWDAKVTFDGNGGSNGGTVTIERGKTLGTLPTSTRTKHRFDGWYTKVEGGTKITSSTTVTKNITYYAHWIPMYTVSYNLNGGNGSNDPVTNVLPITLKAAITRNNQSDLKNLITYDFNGGEKYDNIKDTTSTVSFKFKEWKSTEGDSYKGGAQYNKNKDTTMTAQWTITYTTKATMPYALKRPGYNFIGWNTKKDGTGTTYKSNTEYSITHSTERITLYAIWKPIENTLNLNFYDKDKTLKTYIKKYIITDNDFTIGIPQTSWNPAYKPLDQEYTFLGWSSGDSINTQTQINAWKDVKGIYKNVTKAPGYNNDTSKSDLNVLKFTPSKYVYSEYWGEKNIKIPYATSDSYTGLSFNYYCCWTVSGKYIKIIDENNKHVWKKISVPYIKVNGVWKVIVDTYVKINGNWRSEIGYK